MMSFLVSEVAHHLLSRVNESRVNDEYCDVTVHVDDESFRCHRLVLGAMSEYFHTMFTSNFIESHAEHITLEAVDAPTFAMILDFIYTGKVVITDENVFSLLVASEYLRLSPDVEESCVGHLREMDYIPNAIDIFVFAYATKKKSLISIVSANICKNFHAISRSIKLLELPFNDYYQLLREFKRRATFERFDRYEKYLCGNFTLHTIKRWISHAPVDRLLHFQELTDNIIDLEYVNPEYMGYVKGTLFGTEAGSSSEDLRVLYASRSAASLHVFVGYENDSVDVFTWARDNNWHHSCTLSDRDFSSPTQQKAWIYDGRDIKHLSLGSHLYRLSLVHEQVQFCAASSADSKQDFKVLKPPPVLYRDFNLCVSRNSIYFSHRLINGIERDFPGGIIYVYERELDTWLPVVPPKLWMNKACMFADDNLVYVIGNNDDYNAHRRRYHGYLQAYDRRTSMWQVLGNTRFDVGSGIACCIHKGKIYVNGGSGEAGQTNIFDPVARRWRQGAPSIYTNRTHHQLISYRDCVWAIGGGEIYDGLIMEVYDVFNNKWSIDEGLSDLVTESIISNRTVYSEYPKEILDAIVFDPVK